MNTKEDQTLFKNRLRELMREKGIDPDRRKASRTLAMQLYDKGLVFVQQKHSYDEPSKITDRAIDSVRKKIDTHLLSDTADKLQGEYAKAYSIFFDCSTDYLYGLIPYKNHKVTDIRKETGLSINAIDQLIEMHESAPDRLIPLDFLLENESFKQVLSLFSMYRDRFGKMDVSQNISNFYGFKPGSMDQAIEENVNAVEALDYNVSRKFMKAYDEWTESEQQAAKGTIEKEFPGIHNTKKHP